MKIDFINPDKRRFVATQHGMRIWGGLFLLITTVFFLFTLLQYRIVCAEKGYNRASHCVLERSVLNLYHHRQPIGDLLRANVESSASRKGERLYAVYLQTTTEKVNLTIGHSSGRGAKERVADAINYYLASSLEPYYDIPYPMSALLFSLNSTVFIIGLCLLAIRDKTFVFDKGAQTVTISCKNLMGKEQIQQYSLTEVDKVIIQKSDAGKNSGPVYRLALAFKERAPIPFTQNYNSSKEQIIIANQLNEFLSGKYND